MSPIGVSTNHNFPFIAILYSQEKFLYKDEMNRKHIVFFILGGFFITNAVVAELIAGKIFSVDIPLFFQTFLQWIKVYKTEFIVSVGVIPWPIVFVATDLVNEFFGR